MHMTPPVWRHDRCSGASIASRAVGPSSALNIPWLAQQQSSASAAGQPWLMLLIMFLYLCKLHQKGSADPFQEPYKAQRLYKATNALCPLELLFGAGRPSWPAQGPRLAAPVCCNSENGLDVYSGWSPTLMRGDSCQMMSCSSRALRSCFTWPDLKCSS